LPYLLCGKTFSAGRLSPRIIFILFIIKNIFIWSLWGNARELAIRGLLAEQETLVLTLSGRTKKSFRKSGCQGKAQGIPLSVVKDTPGKGSSEPQDEDSGQEGNRMAQGMGNRKD